MSKLHKPELIGVEIQHEGKTMTLLCSKRVADALMNLKEERNGLAALLLSEQELNARLQTHLANAERRLSDYSWRDSPGQGAY